MPDDQRNLSALPLSEGETLHLEGCTLPGDHEGACGLELTYEPFTPLYIGLLPHYTRRMLQALDAYWLHCDGLPKGRYPRSRSNDEDWWGRFEKYRALVEEEIRGR